MVAKLNFEFFLVGDPWESPEELTDILQITPTTVRHRGEKVMRTEGMELHSFTAKNTYWEFESEDVLGLDLDELTRQILDLFAPKVQLIKEYLSQHPQLRARLCIITYSTQQSFPGLYLSPELISFLGEINADIDFDTYIEKGLKYRLETK